MSRKKAKYPFYVACTDQAKDGSVFLSVRRFEKSGHSEMIFGMFVDAMCDTGDTPLASQIHKLPHSTKAAAKEGGDAK